MIDVKEQMWLAKVKYLWLLLNTSWGLVFCIDAHVCTISKAIGINKEKEYVCQTGKAKVVIDEKE